jgi:hypothetical protein
MSVAYDYQANAKWIQWSAEMEADLMLMRHDGKSASIISEILSKNHNRKVTRNAVIGKSKRLGLPRLKPNAPTEHKWRGRNGPRPKRIQLTRFRRELVAPQPYTGSLDIPFLDIGPNQCREIVGVGVALCCGQPQTAASSYCAHHRAINHWVRP